LGVPKLEAGAIDEAAWSISEALRLRAKQGNTQKIAQSLVDAAALLIRSGRPGTAIRLAAEAESLGADPSDGGRIAAILERQQAVSEDAAGQEAGRRYSLEQAIAEALAGLENPAKQPGT
jgi:hypothetical protein